ncbi:hypothetical protein [Stenotrophomonas phage CM2]
MVIQGLVTDTHGDNMKRIFCRFVKSREIHNFLITEHDKMLADRRSGPHVLKC